MKRPPGSLPGIKNRAMAPTMRPINIAQSIKTPFYKSSINIFEILKKGKSEANKVLLNNIDNPSIILQMAPIQKLILKSKQSLSYLDIGDTKNPVCIYFHGFPGSSKQVFILENSELRRHLRVIAIDRPGFGHSSFAEKASLQDLAKGVEELTDHLNIKNFHLISVSGGTPTAFVVADQLRDRVLSLTTVCGLGPLHERVFFDHMSKSLRFFLKQGRYFPFITTRVLKFIHFQIQKSKTPNTKRMERFLPPEDIKLIFDPEIRQIFRNSMLHAFHQGFYGVALDIRNFQQDWKISNWNFNFPVYLWHGQKDRIVPYQHSELLAQKIQGSHLNIIPGEGHYSLPILHMEEILKPLVTEGYKL